MSHGSQIDPPEHLDAEHDLSTFDCGIAALDDWLKRRALANEGSGASRTYVVTARGKVVGYDALATGAVAGHATTSRVRRNMPDPIPVMIIGRLAVDKTYQANGIGRALLRDAILRTLQAAAIAGIRAILVHAISEDAKRFYERYGFVVSPVDPLTLMITVREAEQALSGK